VQKHEIKTDWKHAKETLANNNEASHQLFYCALPFDLATTSSILEIYILNIKMGKSDKELTKSSLKKTKKKLTKSHTILD